MAFQLSHRHDLIFRANLADPRRADSILRAHLAPRLLPLLAAQPPQPLDGSFVDEGLRASSGDKLLQVQLRSGQPAFLYAQVLARSWHRPNR